jgi:UDPglucose 6-dehydrogenase
LHVTTRRSAELIKYGANALLATRIAFINEMADLCERTGADVREVSRGIGLDRRIGTRFLNPGPGFGGSCFRKDTQALVKIGEDHDVTLRVAEAAVMANECRKRKLLQKVSAAAGTLKGKTVGVWGLTFKANTSDIRESPAIPLITGLLDAGARVQVYDPEGMPAAEQLWSGQIVVAQDALQAVRGAHVLVIMTEWQEFGAANLSRVAALMATPVMVDMRAMYEPGFAAQFGIAYHTVGRATEQGLNGARTREIGNGHGKPGEFASRRLPSEDDMMPVVSP